MPERGNTFDAIHKLLRREELDAVDHAKTHHIPTAFELSRQRSLDTLSGDSGDEHTAEGMAAGKLGIPVEWCPYRDEGYPRGNWLHGHLEGRIYREANPPSLPVLERLAMMLEARLRKTDRDYESRLVGMIAREREHGSGLASRLSHAETRIAQLEGQYGPALDAPAMQLRLSIQPIPFQGEDCFRAFFHGLRVAKSVSQTKEAAALLALEEACNVLRHMIANGDTFDFEWVGPDGIGLDTKDAE